MDEAWPNGPSLENWCMIFENLDLIWLDFLKKLMMMMILFFEKWLRRGRMPLQAMWILKNFVVNEPSMEQNFSKTGSATRNWAKLQLLGWCANQHCSIGTSWALFICHVLTRFQLFFLGHMAAYKLEIDGNCWVDEIFISNPCKKFFS